MERSTLVRVDRAKWVAECMELAILLEVSAHKPGNVSVVTNFEHTRYEHFLASAAASYASFEYAAQQGTRVSHRKMSVSDVALGRIIRNCIAEIDAWQRGGNTLLGAVILLSPIAVAAGMNPADDGQIDLLTLRKDVGTVVESTTPEDAVDVYEAIGIANPSGLNEAPDLDVNDSGSIKKIIDERISLFEVFRIAEKYDNICSEWVNNYPITFDYAYPSLNEQLKNGKELIASTIQTFLEVLAEYPDTFIARKAGIEKARMVSLEARAVLNASSLETAAGRRSLNEFDKRLRAQSNLLNPGTAADIIAATLSLCVLGGYRP
jgi:triphosphoribosyl-dephospho-CoA synthase